MPGAGDRADGRNGLTRTLRPSLPGPVHSDAEFGGGWQKGSVLSPGGGVLWAAVYLERALPAPLLCCCCVDRRSDSIPRKGGPTNSSADSSLPSWAFS